MTYPLVMNFLTCHLRPFDSRFTVFFYLEPLSPTFCSSCCFLTLNFPTSPSHLVEMFFPITTTYTVKSQPTFKYFLKLSFLSPSKCYLFFTQNTFFSFLNSQRMFINYSNLCVISPYCLILMRW